uniref:Truncated Nla_18150 protein n=1 Tax=Neisseria lactamica TaxID=486 RepID=R4NST0_NEILA|nr:truncated Nla_18150 protein [Neisseria lactamica]
MKNKNAFLRSCVPAFLRSCVPAFLRSCVPDPFVC